MKNFFSKGHKNEWRYPKQKRVHMNSYISHQITHHPSQRYYIIFSFARV